VTEANLFLAQGAISVLGAGSQLNSAGEIAAGYSGQSALTVQTGGVVNGGIILLGYNLGAMASATVVGAGSQLNSTGRLYVGFDGQGTLLISAGGSVSDASAVVGVSTGSSGSVLLSGGTWTTQGSLSIGTVGTGTVQINNGGVLTAGSLTVGSSGALTVDPSVVHSGSFTLASGGVLQLAIAGTDPSLYSQLDLTGAGSFTGTIEFDFTDGFAPQAGDTFDMINFGSGTNFSGATFLVEGLAPGFEYTEIISDDSLTLEALDDGDPAAAPEPATAALLGFGVLGAFIAARTKKSKLR
jgi:T5SS/PEP-CTERM-associated repeat protein